MFGKNCCQTYVYKVALFIMNTLNRQELQYRKHIRFKETCAVCLEGTHHSFYGSLVCDACRTFFRRRVIQKQV